jgi:hypothetical protein
MLTKLYELNQISLGSIAFTISHLTVVVIELEHDTPILTISYTDNDDTERQSAALHQQIFDVLLIVNSSVGHYQQNHVLSH